MEIRDGRVAGVRFVPAATSGGVITPTLIVLHDTAGRLDKGSSVAWFRSKECQTSAHFVVERDGEIVQMVRTDRKAYHAGASEWRGQKFCNAFAIGIEIVNPGKMDSAGRAWFGKATSDPVTRKATREHGDGWWLAYTPAQVDAVKRLCRAIVAAYPGCNEITTHWAISPGRKIDPCPLLPLDAIVAYALGEDEPEAADAETGGGRPPAPAAGLPPAPPASVLQTSTGVNALNLGSGGVAATGVAVAKSAQAAKGPDGFDWMQFAIELGTNEVLWIGLAAIVSAAVMYRERIKKLLLGI